MSCPGTKPASPGMKWWIPIGSNPEDYSYCDFCVKAGLVEEPRGLYEFQGNQSGFDTYCDCTKNPASMALDRWRQKLEQRSSKDGPYVLTIYPPFYILPNMVRSHMKLGSSQWTLRKYMKSDRGATPLVFKSKNSEELLPDNNDIEILDFVNYSIFCYPENRIDRDKLDELSAKLLNQYQHPTPSKKDIVMIMKEIENMLI